MLDNLLFLDGKDPVEELVNGAEERVTSAVGPDDAKRSGEQNTTMDLERC